MKTPGSKTMDVAEAVRATLAAAGDEGAIEFEGRWISGGEVRALGSRVEAALAAHGVEATHAVGFIARNRETHVAILAGLIAAERPISMIYAFQSPAALARDIAALRLAAVIASDDDWHAEMIAAADAAHTLRIVIGRTLPFTVEAHDPTGARLEDHHRLFEPGIEILSSGTTGPPKRVFHRSQVLFRSLESGAGDADNEAQTTPELVHWPLGGIGGVLQVARALLSGSQIVLLDRFTVAGAVDAIQRHGLRALALTPTMARMLYHADVPKEDVPTLVGLMGGSGPLDPDLQDKLEARYGLPVIWAMGATEFCGSIISWTLDLKARYGATKRGSTGRALPGCELAVRDPDTARELPPGEVGRLDVRVRSIGDAWIQTTDLVSIDEDGFVFHQGRSDGAIIRGGFKVIPEKVVEALRRHPGVAEAAVVGVADDRLGAVPVAAIVVRPGHDVDAATLMRFARDHLAAPQVPVRFHFLDAMPYTASTKIAIKELKRMIDAAEASAIPRTCP